MFAFLASFFLRCAMIWRISEAVMFRFRSKGEEVPLGADIFSESALPPPTLGMDSCEAPSSLMEEWEDWGESVPLSSRLLLAVLVAPLLSEDGARLEWELCWPCWLPALLMLSVGGGGCGCQSRRIDH